ncbi:conserved hypothetical protein [Vibrio chagasii]|nr:conserved hypothetical protein [Vibrio chagasii]CAH7216735.1 conserved hypothetical protein [Vibrio chagasii]
MSTTFLKSPEALIEERNKTIATIREATIRVLCESGHFITLVPEGFQTNGEQVQISTYRDLIDETITSVTAGNINTVDDYVENLLSEFSDNLLDKKDVFFSERSFRSNELKTAVKKAMNNQRLLEYLDKI